MTLQAATDTTCNTCRKPILNRRSSLQTKCASCVYKAANAKDKELRKAQRQAAIDARKAQAEDRRTTRAKRESLKSVAKIANETQDVFNTYVRLRDAHLGCASCDKPSTWTGGVWHASHLRSVKAAGCLRFHLWNVHKACGQCNHFEGGNVAEYRARIPAKIGADKLAWLDTQNHVVKHDRDYLYRLRKVFAKKARRLKQRLASVSQPA